MSNDEITTPETPAAIEATEAKPRHEVTISLTREAAAPVVLEPLTKSTVSTVHINLGTPLKHIEISLKNTSEDGLSRVEYETIILCDGECRRASGHTTSVSTQDADGFDDFAPNVAEFVTALMAYAKRKRLA